MNTEAIYSKQHIDGPIQADGFIQADGSIQVDGFIQADIGFTQAD